MSAWVELIDRAESARDHKLLNIMRAAQHGQGRSFLEFSKKLKETGS